MGVYCDIGVCIRVIVRQINRILLSEVRPTSHLKVCRVSLPSLLGGCLEGIGMKVLRIVAVAVVVAAVSDVYVVLERYLGPVIAAESRSAGRSIEGRQKIRVHSMNGHQSQFGCAEAEEEQPDTEARLRNLVATAAAGHLIDAKAGEVKNRFRGLDRGVGQALFGTQGGPSRSLGGFGSKQAHVAAEVAGAVDLDLDTAHQACSKTHWGLSCGYCQAGHEWGFDLIAPY